MAASPPSPPPEELDLGATIGFMRQLWSVAHGLQSLSKHMETRLGVTGPQRLVLRILGQLPRSSAGTIASVLKAHPSTLTGVFRRLEERKLIARTTDTQDRRRALFSLTAPGKELNAQRSGTVEAAIRRALGRTSEQDQEATSRLLQAITDELARETQPPPVKQARAPRKTKKKR